MAVNKVCCTCLSFDVEMLSLTDAVIKECLEKVITDIKIILFISFEKASILELRDILSVSYKQVINFIEKELLKYERRKMVDRFVTGVLASLLSGTGANKPSARRCHFAIELEDEMLQNVCTECVLVMRKFVKFKERCLKANHILRQILSQSTYISEALLKSECRKIDSDTIISFDDIPIISDSDINLLQVKLETFTDESKTDIDLENLAESCESMIDSKFSNESARRKKLRKNPAFWESDFAVQITLTNEQQIDELFKREISEIYSKAAFKCSDCFIGFTSNKKYEQHMELHDERRGTYQCVVCKLRFGNSFRLRHHEAAHKNRYKCLRCGELTKSRTQANRHNSQHLDTVLYECALCEAKFQNQQMYKRHIRTAHPTDYVCELCGDYFPSRLYLDKHRKMKIDCTKVPRTIIQCEMCDRPFIKLGNSWYIHMLGHSKEKEQTPPTECQICGHKTLSWNDWSYHFCSEHRNKNVDKPRTVQKKPSIKFICDVCGKTLSAKCKLVQHIHTQHTDGTPYNKFVWQDTCEICSKQILRTNMKRHLSTHTGKKPHKCDVCGKCFTQAYTRDDHARTIHKRIDAYPLVKRRKKNSSEQFLDANGKPLNFPCLLCPKKFNGRQHLIMHERSHTGEKPFSCDVCKRSYVSKHTLGVHRMIHTGEKPYPCELCDQKFTYKSSLQNHMKDHTGETPYVCDICNRGFKSKNNLKRHELVHTGVKNHSCHLCGKTFMHYGSLKLHVNTIHLNLPHPPRKARHRNTK